jgi:hypothetical protein
MCDQKLSRPLPNAADAVALAADAVRADAIEVAFVIQEARDILADVKKITGFFASFIPNSK